MFIISMHSPILFSIALFCTGENILGSHHVACKSANQNSLPDCPDTSVVVATICLGQLPSDGAACTNTSENCLSTYEPYSAGLRALRLRDKIQKCLWKKSKCGIKMEDANYKWDHIRYLVQSQK